MTTLLLSSGRGPREVRVFVRHLAEALATRLPAEIAWTGDPDAPHSATLTTEAAAARWLGTHALIARLRGHGHRKRWFVSVTLAPEALPAPPRCVAVTTMRAGGPGGQNVNKRASAARATDGVSGLAVRAAERRSQAQNRRLALSRLNAALDARHDARAGEVAASLRAQHDRVVRGEPQFQWSLDRAGQLVRLGGGT